MTSIAAASSRRSTGRSRCSSRPTSALIAGFVINKFRGDPSILAPGLETLRELTGRPTYAVLPWLDGPFIDAEDSLALRAPARDGATLDVAVVRLRWMSNFTDLDALASEPGVSVRFTRSAADIERADLVVLPGTKATVEDLQGLREAGLDRALIERSGPTLGICGGYQMLGLTIDDDVESGAGRVDGLGLLPVTTRFTPEKLLQRVSGTVWDVEATGYEIRHGRIDTDERADCKVVTSSARAGTACSRATRSAASC